MKYEEKRADELLNQALRYKTYWGSDGGITVSGGEPLMQKDALIELLKELKGFDIVLYTGHQKEEVPEEIWSLVTYVKYGPFIERLKTTIKPYVGSSNQELIKSEDR